MKNRIFGRRTAAIAAAAVMSVSCMTSIINSPVYMPASTITASAADSVSILQSVGFGEGMYATWSAVSGADGYNVYVDGVQIDSMLIRQYQGYMRADAVGLKAGSHTMKVVPVIGGKEDASKASETKADAYAHDRSGFGFVNGTSSGAYNEDGTLKSNAVVVYVTNENKDKVSVTLPDKKGSNVTLTGVQEIITNLKSNNSVSPVAIRFIGNITDPETLIKGDLYIDAATCGLTIEGIGNDTVFNGFGLVMKNSSNVEVRNIGFMNCNSSEGDDCGLQQGNDHVWVHNCDFFYGDAGSDADQVKGDGALDTKTSTYVTHSYNHFWDNGKCNLQGMKSETEENYVTYHHNWYDHSDSRHPRIRTCTVHSYNNYFDGNAKYGMGVTMGASAFLENNYFRNCKYPALISGQGSDVATGGTFSGETGGIIKAYGNYIEGAKAFVSYSENNTDFDAYVASDRNEKVPSSVTSKSGGTAYNNFDTSDIMYSYTVESPEDAKNSVMAKAGRVDGGDLQWTFDNSVDDESYAVNDALKAALVAYKGTVQAIGSGFKDDNSTPPAQTTASTAVPAQSTTTTAAPVVTPPVSVGGQIHDFTINGTNSSFYTITGNLSTSKGTVNYDNKTLTQCLKMESATNITFNAGSAGKLTLVFSEDAPTIKVDGQKLTGSNKIIEIDLSAGTHTITKADTANLFYMVFGGESGGSAQTTATTTTNNQSSTTTTASAVVTPPVVGSNVIYASPNGKGDGKSMDSPTDALTAIKNVPAGGTIYLLEGTYKYTDTIIIEESNAGKAGAYKTISAYPGAKVVFDFTGQAVDGANRGFVLDGSYWHFYGFEITKAGDNGMLLSGDNNIIEMMVFNNNQDTGLQISRYQTSYNTIAQWPSNNLIKNCTSKNNCDDATMENADGFAAKLTCGEGNVFDGCMSYNNSDDGWDLYAKTETGPIGVVTIKNCIAFRNGFTEDGRGYGDADGNGFKLGGGGVGTRHIVENCLAFENLNCGFTDNNNPLFGEMKDCTAYNNGIGGNGKANYMVYRCASDAVFANMISYTNTSRVSKTNAPGIKLSNDKFVGKMTNSIYYNSKYYFAESETMTNGAKLGEVITPSDSDFISLDVPAMGTDFHTTWRNADGSPNPGGFAEYHFMSGVYDMGYHMSNGTQQTIVTTQTTTSAKNTTATTTTTTTATTVTTAKTTGSAPSGNTNYGDANEDGKVSLADAVLIMQALSNPDEYKLSEQGVDNADVYRRGDGISPSDALSIQKLDLGLIESLPESYQS